MENTITIQISVYHWTIIEEIIYEVQIDSIDQFLAITNRFGEKVMYKKDTDKYWYHARTMVERLIKNELSTRSPLLKFVTTNDISEMYERKQMEEEKDRQMKEDAEQARAEWRMYNADFSMEQIMAMSEDELTTRLTQLYADSFHNRKSAGDDDYYGPFKNYEDEIAYIELQVSSKIADQANSKAFEEVFGSNSWMNQLEMPDF
ncbi:hypothetical protein SAMN05428981_12122 [Bacillus sp. OV194]|nr:hypothetical protein SAMN05428981_12122 [Bacillus sp. OV194]